MDRSDARSLRTDVLSHAARHPDDVALAVGGASIGYGELARTARAWAGRMIDARGGRLDRVGVFAYRSATAYTGVLAALCSGATFVPLNPTFPVARTRQMLRRAALDAVIVDPTAAAQIAEVLEADGDAPLLVVPDETAQVPRNLLERALGHRQLADAPPLSDLPPIVPEDLAYLLFTSGTTGEPKGVGVTHGNALHFMDVMSRRYGLTSADRLSQTFDQTFDLSVFDMFMAWHAGAMLCVPGKIDMLAPARFVAKHALTLWFSVPSVVALMRKKNLIKPGSMPTLRWSLFCGEPLPRASADAWQAAAPNSIVENLFGPTELTIACTVHRWTAGSARDDLVHDLVPIGRPLEGLGAVLVDEALRPVRDGEPGELCVSGPQTVPGYWQDPVRTAERFVQLPVSPFEQRRFYRTGDRVVALRDGSYAYLGRTDHQIKVLGFRVELGEIEAVLAHGRGVLQAACVGWPLEDSRATGIVGFVVGPDADPPALLADAQQRLPPYMVPNEILLLDEFPLNANGKVDRNALVAMLRARTAADAPTADRSA
jgi:amino acid adenylation domain-containing protein